jgi:hypothetical protein
MTIKKGEFVLSVIDDLLDPVGLDWLDAPVQDVLIGLHWQPASALSRGIGETLIFA